MLQLETKQINPKLKFYIMKKRQQKKQEIEAECLRQEKQEREKILTELNGSHEKFSILEKELSNYREKKDQLLKELDVTNKILKQTEEVKIQKMNNDRNMVIKENSAGKNREHLTHHKIALQNKIIDASPLSAPIIQTPLMIISADSLSPAIYPNKTHVNKKLPSNLNGEVQLKTNLHVPRLHSSLTLGINDSNHKSAFSPFKKSSKPVKSSPRNFKSQNKTRINTYNLHSLKENKDINKQDICDDNFADIKLNQDIDVRIRRSRISFDYSHLSSAQLQLNPSPVPSLYPYSPYLSDINPNLNLHASSTYITSNINPNFVPPLTYANQIPLLSSVTCDGTSYMNPTYLSPIYSNVSHVQLPSSLIPVTWSSTSHITSTSLPTVSDVKSNNNSPPMVTTKVYFNTFCGDSPSCNSS
ncbi:uncharacterized protein LOC126858168 isoform X3 [Cataglyphis hispanica]|uniref:uncharacterized protein LOC126858168 isoform X3 n=1 Tax=Cataglyphis hispanica TaxID=1086592 RepID=UPI00217F24B9|nr:uncharacterized protein LOC126858168 isoform X3 [Cataglyphis hispanica]